MEETRERMLSSSREESFGYKALLDREVFVDDEFLTKCKKEKKRVSEELAEMVNFVDKRYEGQDSTLSNSFEQLKSFKEHNRQILDKCIERGIERGLSQEDLTKLEIAAILHDFSKGDSSPKWAQEIENFMLVYHGEAVAKELDSNEELRNILRDKLGGNNFEENIIYLQRVIKSHMGPHPGFMSKSLEIVNKQLKEKNLQQIEHPSPKEGDRVAEILLAADMYTLASSKGMQKVVTIRSETPSFRKQDKELSSQYAQVGIELAPAEAAILSALDSAYAARDMIKNKEDWNWIQGAIEEANNFDYKYRVSADARVSELRILSNSIEEVLQKRQQFEDKKKTEKISEEIRLGGGL